MGGRRAATQPGTRLHPRHPPFISALDAIFWPNPADVSRTTSRKVQYMDQNQQVETELVSEALVEEVSIDGMCGVY
ncbi:mycofactocin precursor [Mycolicibacterium insubricum]|uniref:Mycofactocin n=1 Tax=Mycolicibacterium insubricum TaxID=444597 RepID=A0A1X0DC88_9MYCO|nr:mycofactocin precursor [Mycolicibacterium insubricum]